MIPPLPQVALALAGTTSVLVVTRQGQVQHLAEPGPRGLTAGGRLRRGVHPACGRRARRWTALPEQPAVVDGRPMCALCAVLAARRPDAPQLREQAEHALTAGDLAAVLNAATHPRTVAACSSILVRRPELLFEPAHDRLGHLSRLGRVLGNARDRTTPTAARRPREPRATQRPARRWAS